jgi:hypothetical protein
MMNPQTHVGKTIADLNAKAAMEEQTAKYWRAQYALQAADLERLREAAGAAYRAIVLGNGREIDWNEIADDLREALKEGE